MKSIHFFRWANVFGMTVFCIAGCSVQLGERTGPTESNNGVSRPNQQSNDSNSRIAAAQQMIEASFRQYYTEDPHYVRLDNEMVFAIPSHHHPFWIQGNRVHRSPHPLEKVPKQQSIGFQMFFPNFGGYTFENFSEEFHKDRIDITLVEPVTEEQIKNNPALYGDARKIIERDGESGLIDTKNPKDMYGLTCYRNKLSQHEAFVCIGKRLNEEIALIEIDEFASAGEWPLNPRVRVRYFSKLLGGMQIRFDISRNHLEEWRDADVVLWEKLEAWRYKYQELKGTGSH